MECTNLLDPHQLLCPWFTVIFVLFCIYTPTICSQDRLSTKLEVYFGKVSAFHPFIFQKSGKSLLALKIRISVANMGKLRSIGQVPVTYA
jgi:hypothetical protein